MDERSQTRLDKILKLDPSEVSTEDAIFLRARRSYLKTSELEEYESILKTKPPKKEPVKQNGKENK